MLCFFVYSKPAAKRQLVFFAGGTYLSLSNVNVITYTASSANAQVWRFIRQENGSYKIINQKTGMVLDAVDLSGDDGTNVRTRTEEYAVASGWYIYGVGGLNAFRCADLEDLMLTVEAGSSEPETNIHLGTFTGQTAQRFMLERVNFYDAVNPINLGDTFYSTITNVGSGLNVSLDPSGSVNVVQSSSSPTTYQLWQFVRQGDGSYEIINQGNGFLLNNSGGNINPGTNINTRGDENLTQQRWFIYLKEGNYILRPACASDNLLTVKDGSIADGANIQTETAVFSEAQMFFINSEACGGTAVNSVGVTAEQMAIFRKIMYAVETGGQVYGNADYSDFTEAYTNTELEHSITIGAGQWYGPEAKELLSRIRDKDNELFASLDTAGIGADLDSANWSSYQISKSSDKAKCIVAIISTDVGKSVQDEMIDEQMIKFMEEALDLGVTNIDALMMCANIRHLGGLSALKRILNKTSQPYTVDNIWAAMQSDTGNQAGAPLFRSRHEFVIKYLNKYIPAEPVAVEHSFGYIKVERYATCEQTGLTFYLCNNCNYVKKEVDPMLEHTWGEKTCAGTLCTVCGVSDGTPAGHNKIDLTFDATCVDYGAILYFCSECGEDLGMAEIAPLGHDYHAKVTAPTCNSQGYTTHTCSRCSESYKDAYTDALGHSYSGATCTGCGIARDYYLIGYINGANHGCEEDAANLGSYKFVGGKVKVTFDSDSYVFVKTGDNLSWYMTNSWMGQVNSATLYNTDLGIDANKLFVPGGMEVTFSLVVNTDETMVLSYVINNCSHSYTSVVDCAATCTANGMRTYTCSKCGDSYHEEIAALGHSYVGDTCSACGHVRSYYLIGWINGVDYGCEGDWENLGKHLFVNGKVTVTISSDSYLFVKTGDNQNWYMTEGVCFDKSATLHNTNKGLTDANKIFVPGGTTVTFTLKVNTDETLVLSYVIDKCVHNYSNAITQQPTCESAGIRTYTCSICDDTYTQIVAALGHSYDNGVVTKQLTCTANGVKTFTCSACSCTRTETIAKLGHNYQSTVNKPSCTDKGCTIHTCSRCGDSYITDYVEATGHSWDGGSVTLAPTCTSNGTRVYSCTVCGRQMTEMIDALGHSYQAVVTVPTCNDGGYTTHTCSKCNHSYQDQYTNATGHSYDNGVITTAPGCTHSGIKTYTCASCGYQTTEMINATGHAYTAVVTAPSCTSSGYTTYTCVNCGHSYKDHFTNATGHSWDNGMITTQPTCVADGIRTYTCQNCGAQRTEIVSSLGHSYSAVVTAPTCTAAGYTTYTCHCGDTYIADHVAALGHSYNAVVTAPTCTEAGYTTYTCHCGDSYVADEVAALGHSWNSGVITKAPTCTEKGIKTYTCTVCGATKAEDVAATGHSHSAVVTAPTCTAEGYTTYTCHCGDSYVADRVSALGHSYNAVVTAPTCTEAGYTTYTCHCGDSYVTDEVAALGHDYSSVTEDATCTENGSVTYTCGTCGDTYVEVIEATGHSYDAVVTAPTCTESGYTTYTCHCGDSYVADRVSALGHSYNAVVTAPTCGAAGYTTYTCSVCGDSYVGDEVAATGAHNYCYAFVDSKHTVTCSGCTDVISVAGTNELKFRNATLSLASDICVIFKLDIDDVFEVGYMVFEVNGEETYVYDYTIDESNGRKVFAYQGINPQMMGDSINCTIHAYLNGTEVTVSYNGYSVVKYCNSQFGKTDATVKQVCANLLNYGAAVQLKKGYKTDALVNANLPVAPETFPGVGAITNQQAMSGAAIGTTDIKSVALQLSNKVEIKVGMVLDNPADYEIKVTIKGNEFTYGESDLEFDEASGRYYLYFSNLNARDFDETITFVILKDGVEVSRTLTYSVNSYIAKNGGADTADGNTLRALYCYGKSTESLSN